MRYREYFLVTHFRGKYITTEKMYSEWTVMGLQANRVIAVVRMQEAY